MLNKAPAFPTDRNLPNTLKEFTTAICRIAHNSNTGNRAEDLISATAAFTGESAMRQAGEFDFDGHAFNPGQPLFSAVKVNEILFGDHKVWTEMPSTSVFGLLYRALTDQRTPNPWPCEAFPDVGALLRLYAAARSKGVAQADWGKVPLSVPPKHFPSERMPPLRAAYEIRRFVYSRWRNEDLTPIGLLNLAKLGMASVMTFLRPHIEPKIGLSIAFETINGTAKMAPFLPQHMQQLAAAHQEKEIELVQ